MSALELKPCWIWLPSQPKGEYVFAAFRREFNLEQTPVASRISICADSFYRLWVNGILIGGGPCRSHTTESFFDSYEGLPLRQGKNLICVQVQFVASPTGSHLPKAPGLCCETIADGIHRAATDDSWECREMDEYESELPRRNFALAFPERLDLTRSEHWQAGQRTRMWSRAALCQLPDIFGFACSRPILRFKYTWKSADDVFGVWSVGDNYPEEEIDPAKAISPYLDSEPLREPDIGSFMINGQHLLFDCSTHSSWATTFDLGEECAGHIFFELESQSGGIVQAASAELLTNDGSRPWTCRRNLRGASQVKVGHGKTRWLAWDYTGCRYIHLVFRGFKGRLRLLDKGLLSRHADLPAIGRLETSDSVINRICQIGLRTASIACQDLLVDCPTREQAQYWGDTIVMAPILAAYHGDTSYLRLACVQAFQSQREDGLIPSNYPASFRQILYDYSLIPVFMVWQHHHFTGDTSLIRDCAQHMEKLLDYFDHAIGSSGCVEIDGRFDNSNGNVCVFIDHPGLGWHDFDHPGIVRNGINAGLNFFFTLACRAFADLMDEIGCGDTADIWEAKADSVSHAAEKLFWIESAGHYADACDPVSNSLSGLSQQTNSLAILAGVACERKAPRIAAAILDEANPKLCRCTPYFYQFMIPALAAVGKSGECLALIRKYWGRMLDKGATTTWESFDGGWKDSLCHAWSAAPTFFLLKEWAGFKTLKPNFAEVLIEPRFLELDNFKASMATPFGLVSVDWSYCEDGDSVTCLVEVPKGLSAFFRNSVLGDERYELREGCNVFEIIGCRTLGSGHAWNSSFAFLA